jgi:outer membrane protein assembly factor BamB
MSRHPRRTYPHSPLFRIVAAIVLTGPGPGTSTSYADDWPQWRGPNRDAKATGFTAPKTWPKELTKKWKVTVGKSDATPALVGDKLYVFAFDGTNEVLRCLDATTGKETWQEKYETKGATAPAAGPHEGPRSSPAVADGKVVTLGVRGVLSCFDAASGKNLWRKDEFKGYWPQFYTSSSPIIVDGLCVAQLGGKENGRGNNKSSIVAYELATGAEKWKWDSDATAYASPSVLTVDGTKVIVAETEQNLVAIGAADGKPLWKIPYAIGMGGGAPPKGGGGKGGKGGMTRGYNASTPITDGQTLIYSGSGRGTKAVKLEKKGDELAAKELWNNTENSVGFNTPIVKDGLVFGLTAQNSLFCIDKDGKTAWTAPIKGRGGYGSIVDAGSVLFVLTPIADLIAFEPSDKGYKDLATYKVADTDTYAYPVVSGNRIYVKDGDSVTLWTIE